MSGDRHDGRDDGRIDAYAFGLAANVRFWDAEASFHLYEMLSHRLGCKPAALARYEKLGLLVEIIAEGTGEVPSVETYQRRRAEAADRGESWPSHAALAKAYLGWTRAVDAAMKLHFGTRQVPVSSRYLKKAFKDGAYSNAEILASIGKCRDAIGFWPTQWEYQHWGRIQRKLARRSGITPRIPGIDVVRRAFGSYDVARNAAERHHSLGCGGPEQLQIKQSIDAANEPRKERPDEDGEGSGYKQAAP